MTKLQTQLKNAEEIKGILKEVDFSHTWGIESVDVRLIYLPCVDGICNVLPLLELIKKCLITNFVLSHKAIQKRLEINHPEPEEELFNRAVRFISKQTAHGELGELLLFTLLDVYLEAPKILSKVSMKTSPRMPVYGADAVHAQYVDGELRLYLGESKLYQSFKDASREAAESISTALNNYEHEFNLIETHINFPEFDDDIADDLIELLNPFSNNSIRNDMLHSPCFIGFAEPNCFIDERNYLEVYTRKASEYIDYYFEKLRDVGIHHNKTTLLMLPFSSIKDVVGKFINHMGIEA